MRSILDQVEDEAQYQRTNTMVGTLVLAKVVSTYAPTSVLAGYGENQQRNPNYHRHLGRTMEEDFAAGGGVANSMSPPFRAATIINAKWGMPGEQFFEKARQLGFVIPHRMERDFWADNMRRLGQDPTPGNLRVV